ncbi:YSIRK-type signal peptide-containing protein [Macrococcus armenti]|uniref:YSIRK-type signal peptide-containing protein n=1 Tax=Macrococcus armenti TaxID=2875764 RepID=A0ABY3ZU36_9STAP|nr:YSIRK-type signal peptide-containing protein [Macrococcus armenti]UOB20417.1 YSIRK-type signal peptide-containing protein [Macrococcus armenti]
MSKHFKQNGKRNSFSIRKRATGVASLLLSTIILVGNSFDGQVAKAQTATQDSNVVASASIDLIHTLDGYLSFDEDRDGTPDIYIPNIQVDLFLDGKVVETTITDSDGYFKFSDVFQDQYQLRFTNFYVPGEDTSNIDWSARTFVVNVGNMDADVIRTNIVVKKKKPVVENPTTEAPTTELPTTELPTTEAPTTEAPTTEAPTTELPTTEAPTTELPTTELPTTEAPTTEAPTTEAPTTEAPTIEAPTTELPTTELPTTEAPTTEVPTTEAPTIEAPTTEAPTTEAPTTEAPTTEVPTTELPTTEAPTTEAPTTEVPTTELPTTEAPTTEVPTVEIPFENGESTYEVPSVVHRNELTTHSNESIPPIFDIINGDRRKSYGQEVLSSDVLTEGKSGKDIHRSRLLIFKTKISVNRHYTLPESNDISKKHTKKDNKSDAEDNKEIISIDEPKAPKTPPFKEVDNEFANIIVDDPIGPGEIRGLTTFASSIGGLMIKHKGD